MPINAISSPFSSFAGQLLSSSDASRVADLLRNAQEMQNVRRASQTFHREATDNIHKALTNVRDLASRARELDPSRFENAFQLRSAPSSHENIVTAKADRNATTEDISVRVDQLAREQLNTGTGLTANATTNIQAGTNTFQIQTGGETQQLTVSIDSGATNEEAFSAVAAAINQTDNLDIEATALSNTATGITTLQLRGANTGEEEDFTVSDISGNAVAITGIANVRQTSQNAISVVYGTQIETGANQISVDDGRVQLNFQGVSTAVATIKVGPDNGGIASTVADLASQFNTTLAATGVSNQFITNSIAQTLRNAVVSGVSELQDIGVVVDSSGNITVNEEQLAAALKEDLGAITETLAGREGLSTNIANAADRLFIQPISHFTVSQPALNRQNQIRQYRLALIQAQAQSGDSLLSGPSFIVNNIT